MQTTASVDQLCQLSTIGPKKAEILIESGFDSYEALAVSSPIEVHTACDIVMSDVITIIRESVELLDGVCPECHSQTIIPKFTAWSGSLKDGSKSTSEVVCDGRNCSWEGRVAELKR